jgi:predicted porin
MKKLFVGSAFLAAAGVCSAQAPEGVQLYGIVDAGLNYVSGLKGGSQKRLDSGIMEGTRWGLRGGEDLGAGWRALYFLESRVEVDNGALSSRPISGTRVPDRLSSAAALNLPSLPPFPAAVAGVATNLGNTLGVNLTGKLFDRQAFVGLVTPVGAVLAGRQYTPAYRVLGEFDTLGTQSSLSVGQVGAIPASVDIRADNALQYRVSQGPFSGALMVAAGEGSATTGRLWGALAIYRTGAFGVGFGHNQRENESGDKSLRSTVLGASVKAGPGDAGVFVAKIKDDNPSGLSTVSAGLQAQGLPSALANQVQSRFIDALRQDAMIYQLGYKMTTGPNTFYVAYNRFNDKRASNADVKSYGVVHSYALSKRTDINTVLTRFDNSANAQVAPGQAGFLGGVTASAGTDSTNVALGIRHRF